MLGQSGLWWPRLALSGTVVMLLLMTDWRHLSWRLCRWTMCVREGDTLDSVTGMRVTLFDEPEPISLLQSLAWPVCLRGNHSNSTNKIGAFITEGAWYASPNKMKIGNEPFSSARCKSHILSHRLTAAAASSLYATWKWDRKVPVFSIAQNYGKSPWFSGLLWTKLMENSWPVGRTMNVFPVEYVSLYVHTHVWTCMHTHRPTYNHICMCTCIHKQVYMHVHTHTHLQFHLYRFLSDCVFPLTLIFPSLLTTVLFSLYSLGVCLQGWQRDAPKVPLLLGIAKGQVQQVTARAPSITWFWLLFLRLMFSLFISSLSLPCPLTLTKNFI